MSKFDLRVASEQDIVYERIELPDNATLYSICNYPGNDLMNRVDEHCVHMKPPNSLWDEVVQAGGRDSSPVKSFASKGFIPRYIEHLSTNDKAYLQAAEVKARSKVRPVYLIHDIQQKKNSPATILKEFMLTSVDLDIANDIAKG